MLPVLSSASAAKVEIQGVGDSVIEENIRAHIDSIEPPTDSYQFAQYKVKLTEKVDAATQVFGYYHVKTVITHLNADPKNQKWILSIGLGRVTLLHKVSVKVGGQGADDPEITSWLSSVKLKQGQPLQHTVYENAKKQLKSLALSRGYFDFVFEENSIEVFESEYKSDVKLHANTGRRYQFGELIFAEDQRAKKLINNLLPFKIGDFYQASQLGLLSRRLKQTQYFKHVIVRPLVSKEKNYLVPLEIILTFKPRDNFDLGAGVSSDVGPRFTGKWQRPWVNDNGHALSGEVHLSSPEQYVSIDYKVPLEDAVQNYLSYQAGFQTQNDNDTDSEKLSISVTRHWTGVGSDWQRSAFVRLEQETFTQGIEAEQTTRLFTPGITLNRLRSRGGLDIDWGDKQTLTAEFASDSVLSDINIVRVTAESKWVRSYGQHRFLWRAELGGIATNDFSQVPSSSRFFTGGDQSVRGFDYNTLSSFELDADGEPELTGGQYLAVASFEYSYPVANNWRAAAFIDAGNASDDLFKDSAVGIGIGAIWNSPIGPVRLYLAKGQSDSGSTRFFHLSMGPSL